MGASLPPMPVGQLTRPVWRPPWLDRLQGPFRSASPCPTLAQIGRGRVGRIAENTGIARRLGSALDQAVDIPRNRAGDAIKQEGPVGEARFPAGLDGRISAFGVGRGAGECQVTFLGVAGRDE